MQNPEILPIDNITILGTSIQKKYFYLIIIFIIIVVGYFAWKWYKSDKLDKEEILDESQQ